jgi:hypothetical protein
MNVKKINSYYTLTKRTLITGVIVLLTTYLILSFYTGTTVAYTDNLSTEILNSQNTLRELETTYISLTGSIDIYTAKSLGFIESIENTTFISNKGRQAALLDIN